MRGLHIATSIRMTSGSHKIDIGGLVAGGKQVLSVSDDVRLESFEGIIFPNPAHVRLEMRYVNRLLHIEGQVEVEASGECDSCLEGMQRALNIDVDEQLDPGKAGGTEPFGESNVLTGDRLDVADLAQQLVLSGLPMGMRCSEECRGLCETCGTNKNTDTCSCDNGERSGQSKVENPAQ